MSFKGEKDTWSLRLYLGVLEGGKDLFLVFAATGFCSRLARYFS